MADINGVHPYADRFPMLPEDELARLAEDIRENGLRTPIVIDGDGLILDGRNRYAACERAGVEPVTVPHDGGDVAAFILSANVARRHQSTGSRAMSTALVLADAGKREGGRWKRGSVVQDSELGRPWQVAMASAGVILDHAPDLAEQVVSGALALDAAHREAEQRRDAERLRMERIERERAEEAEAQAFIESEAPDLARMVGIGDGYPYQSYAEAKAVWEKRNREAAARLRAEEARRAADEQAARETAEREVQSSARALQYLEAAQHPDWRARLIDHHKKHALAVEPAARECWQADRIRQLATWLTALAIEMEQTND